MRPAMSRRAATILLRAARLYCRAFSRRPYHRRFVLPRRHVACLAAQHSRRVVRVGGGADGVHLVFFLHITTAPDNTNNVLALAFGVLIVGLIVFGSLWIMGNLNHNMVPMLPMG